jgi:LuxR family glucitol operon transcriptional activator
MTYSATRQTLYAILSAIEMDLRNVVLRHLDGAFGYEVILGQEAFDKALSRFRNDNDAGDDVPSLSELLPYADFLDSLETLARHKDSLPENVRGHVIGQLQELAKLAPVRNRIAHTRPLQFEDLPLVIDIAKNLADWGGACFPSVSAVIKRLQDEPSFVLGLQIPVYPGADEGAHRHNLPLPDFDETGFLGREEQVGIVLKHILGPYPVISILGDGGVGKTAMALKVAYDILDMAAVPFDKIIWTSSKTQILSLGDIKKVEGAIADSIGMLSNVAASLGAPEAAADPIGEVLSYLQAFRILLIIDNLETILDDRIKKFLENLPNGTKVLITSRIGVGAGDLPVKIGELPESVRLLRAVAQVRGVKTLTATNNGQLGVYCSRMKNNPGWIKWFVAAVQAGRRPEEVLANPDKVLDYCMANVYAYLSPESQAFLAALLFDPHPHTLAELAYLTELSHDDLQRAAQQVLMTNMVAMASVARGRSYESRYSLGAMAKPYLQRHHPVSPEQWQRFNTKQQQIRSMQESLDADHRSNRYDKYYIAMRSRSDLIVAKYLRDALDASKAKAYDAAEELVSKALTLEPGYYEVHRVGAWVSCERGNFAESRERYEAAIELEPESAPLRYWFGGFLLRHSSDVEAAQSHFLEGAKLDPASPHIALEIARCHLYAKNFEDAEAWLKRVGEFGELPGWAARKAADLRLQVVARRADYLQGRKDSVGALQELERLRQRYEATDPSVIDHITHEHIAKVLPVAAACERFLFDAEAKRRAQRVVKWLSQFDEQPRVSQRLICEPQPHEGRITTVLHEKGFAYLHSSDNERLFFHRNEWLGAGEWGEVKVGMEVTYAIGENRQGKCAVNVMPKYDSPDAA